MLLQHPSRYVWDFWYYYEEETGLYHVLFLNADRALVPQEQHHFHAEVGYAITEDFIDVEWIDGAVFSADPDGWDNTSIWTGDVVAVPGGYALFYTSRDRRKDDGMTQNIGLAFSQDFRRWERVPGVQIEPETRWYEPRSVPGEKTIHAWRDPFPISHGGEHYLLVTAKDNQAPKGRKGCVGLLRGMGHDLTQWEVLPPLWSPGLHEELEVTQIYREDENRLQLVYGTGAEAQTMCVRLDDVAGLGERRSDR